MIEDSLYTGDMRYSSEDGEYLPPFMPKSKWYKWGKKSLCYVEHETCCTQIEIIAISGTIITISGTCAKFHVVELKLRKRGTRNLYAPFYF
jgi:hypothetical protein